MIPYNYNGATMYTGDTYQGTGTRGTTIVREVDNLPLGWWSAETERYESPSAKDAFKKKLERIKEKELYNINKIEGKNYINNKRVNVNRPVISHRLV